MVPVVNFQTTSRLKEPAAFSTNLNLEKNAISFLSKGFAILFWIYSSFFTLKK